MIHEHEEPELENVKYSKLRKKNGKIRQQRTQQYQIFFIIKNCLTIYSKEKKKTNGCPIRIGFSIEILWIILNNQKSSKSPISRFPSAPRMQSSCFRRGTKETISNIVTVLWCRKMAKKSFMTDFQRQRMTQLSAINESTQYTKKVYQIQNCYHFAMLGR